MLRRGYALMFDADLFGSSATGVRIQVQLATMNWLLAKIRKVTSDLPTILKLMTTGAFMKTQLISCRLPKPIARYTVVALSQVCRLVSSASDGLALARESLSRGLGSRWFTERFHRNALVTHFQHGQVFCAARRLENYAVARCRLHQRARQR